MTQTILGIDIGSNKICAVIADVRDDVPHIVGMGNQHSNGIKKGLIVNIDLASRAIKAAIADAKRTAGVENLNKAIVSLSGAYTKSINSSGIYNVTENEIGIKEIGKALGNAVYNASVPQEFDIIHVLPFKFKLDNQDCIEDPRGMTGHRLEVFVHIVTAQHSSLENLKKTIHLAGVEIENIVLSSYASSITVLSDDEKELGVACIDIGASTCEIMIHDGNAMCYNSFLGVGSHHITSDLAMALNTKIPAAEEIKITFGNLQTPQSDDERIEVPSVGVDDTKHFVYVNHAKDVIRARIVETFGILAEYLNQSGLKDRLGAGVVLTGGMMNMDGIRDLAVALFRQIPTRISRPIEMPGLFDELRNPAFSAVLGLIWYGAGKHANYERDSNGNIRYKEAKTPNEIPIHTLNREYKTIMSSDLSDLKEALLNQESFPPKKSSYSSGSIFDKVGKFLSDFAKKLF